MGKVLKVYGWTGFRTEAGTYHSQTRELLLAASKAEVVRVTGLSGNYVRNEVLETGNDEEMAAARDAGRGVRVWRPLDSRGEWNRDGEG